jgi:hypothetical protein
MTESPNRTNFTVSRRQFWGPIAGATLGLFLPQPGGAAAVAEEPRFVIVNGWVLTRADVAGDGADT